MEKKEIITWTLFGYAGLGTVGMIAMLGAEVYSGWFALLALSIMASVLVAVIIN